MLKLLGVELHKEGKHSLVARSSEYLYVVCDTGMPGPIHFNARISRVDGTMSHAAYGESEQAAVDALHEKMQFAARELAELLRPLHSE